MVIKTTITIEYENPRYNNELGFITTISKEMGNYAASAYIVENIKEELQRDIYETLEDYRKDN